MTAILVILLAVLWGAVFLPTILRARQGSSPIATVGRFRRGMSALSPGREHGRWILMPPKQPTSEAARRRTIYRRRQFFNALIFSAVATLILGLVPDIRWFLFVHLGIDAVLLGYVLLLLRIKQKNPVKTYAPKHSATPLEDEGEEEYLEAGQL